MVCIFVITTGTASAATILLTFVGWAGVWTIIAIFTSIAVTAVVGVVWMELCITIASITVFIWTISVVILVAAVFALTIVDTALSVDNVEVIG